MKRSAPKIRNLTEGSDPGIDRLALALTRFIGVEEDTDGYKSTPVPGVRCAKISRSGQRAKRKWHATLAIVAEGCKEVALEHSIHRCDPGAYSLTPVELPVVSRVVIAGADRPFLCLLIDFDAAVVREISDGMEWTATGASDFPLRALFVGRTNEAMVEASVRLVSLFDRPADARVLGPLVVRELFYHLLRGPDGASIRQFVRSGTRSHRISEVVHRLRSDLDAEVDVTALAKDASMSRSAFFKSFREMTGLSPIQFQKRFRLMEARRLMTEEDATAEGSAFRVGYASASQFSREYSRMFGRSPSRDAFKLKKT